MKFERSIGENRPTKARYSRQVKSLWVPRGRLPLVFGRPWTSFSKRSAHRVAVCAALLALPFFGAMMLLIPIPVLSTAALGASRAPVLVFGDALVAGFPPPVNRTPRQAPFHRLLPVAVQRRFVRDSLVTVGSAYAAPHDLLAAALKSVHWQTQPAHASHRKIPGLRAVIDHYRPGVIIIAVGGNDVMHDSKGKGRAKDIAGKIWRLHQIAHRRGVRTIALGVPKGWHAALAKTSSPSIAEINSQCDAVNAELKRLAQKHKRFAAYADFPMPVGQRNRIWSKDGMKLTKGSYKRLADLLADIGMRALQGTSWQTIHNVNSNSFG